MMNLAKSELLDLVAKDAAIFEVDMDSGAITWASPALEWMFGYPIPGELEGKAVEVLIPEPLREKHAKVDRVAFAADPTPRRIGERGALVGLRKDGTTFPVEITLRAKAAGKVTVVVGVVFDLTARGEKHV